VSGARCDVPADFTAGIFYFAEPQKLTGFRGLC